MRFVLFAVLLSACSRSYPRLPAPIEVAPQQAAPSVRATDLLRLRDATGSATSAMGVWDSETSYSRRARIAQASHDTGVLGYRLVQVSPTTLSFDGRRLLPLADGAVPEVARRGNVVTTLTDELERFRLAAEEGAELDIRPAFDGTLYLEVAPTVTVGALTPVLWTAGTSQYPHIRLLGPRPDDMHTDPDTPLAAAVAFTLSDGTGETAPTATLCPETASTPVPPGARLAIGQAVTTAQLTASLDGVPDVTVVQLGAQVCQ